MSLFVFTVIFELWILIDLPVFILQLKYFLKEMCLKAMSLSISGAKHSFPTFHIFDYLSPKELLIAFESYFTLTQHSFTSSTESTL